MPHSSRDTAESTIPPHAPRPPLPSLTGIRFIAAFLVVLFHLNITLKTFDPSQDRSVSILTHGYIGVSLFFVLSGFILTYTYIVGDASLRGSRRAFWRARFARIYPVYLFALFISAPLFTRRLLFTPLSPLETGQTAIGGLLTPLLLQAWWPTAACQWNCAGWSLSVEAFFYALFPLVAVWLARRHPRGMLLGASVTWLASLAFPLLYLAIAPDGITHVTESTKAFWLFGLKYNPLVHVGEFTVGIACGLLFLRNASRPAQRPVPGWAVLALLALIVTIVTSEVFPYPLIHSGLLAPLFAWLVYLLAIRDRAGARSVVSSALMVRLGECSYALYLLHPSIITYLAIAARRIQTDALMTYTLLTTSLIASVVASMLIFDRVEEPARHWLRKRDPSIRRVTQSAASALPR